jgi:multidrug efflux system outer membrane protein
MHRLWTFPAIAAALLLAGCQTTPPDQTGSLAVETRPAWASESAVETTPEEPVGWLDDFEDPVLSQLVREAVENNYSLDAALARLDRAYATSRVNGADVWPSLSANFRASRNARTRAGGFELTSTVSNTFTPTINASWELDIWGRVRDGNSAAIGDFEAAQAVFEAFRLSLAARTASSWITAVEAKLLLDIAETSLKSFENSLAIVEDRVRRGLATPLEYQLTKSSVANSRSAVQRRRRLHDVSLRSLQVLLGRYPDAEIEVADALPEISLEVPAGLPADLLNRRPDIVEAERRLAAASKRVSSSKKSLLPAIRLTGSAGTSSTELEDIANLDFKVWSVAGSLTQPIFQGGRLRAEVDRSKANYNEALADFNQTTLVAFREVEQSLAAERFYRLEEDAQRSAVKENSAAARLAGEEYLKGLTEITTYLEAQRRANNAETNLIAISAQRIQSRLDLYLALGGDFDLPDETAQTE